jgi:hypothetical protein
MTKQIAPGTYSTEAGPDLAWEDGYALSVHFDYGQVVLKANPTALRTLARQLLTMAESEVPDGAHVHHEPGRELEDNSLPLILNRGF